MPTNRDGDVALGIYCDDCPGWHFVKKVHINDVQPAAGHESDLLNQYYPQDASFALIIDPLTSTSQSVIMDRDGCGEEVEAQAIQICFHLSEQGGILVEYSDPMQIKQMLGGLGRGLSLMVMGIMLMLGIILT